MKKSTKSPVTCNITPLMAGLLKAQRSLYGGTTLSGAGKGFFRNI